MFGRLLGSWYTIYTFSGALAPIGILPGAKFTFASKSCVLLYWQRYCTALEQCALAKLCGVVSSRDRAAIPFDIGLLNCLVTSNFSRHMQI